MPARAVALDMSKAFDRVCHAGLLHKFKSYEIPGQILGLIQCFVSNKRFRVVLDGSLCKYIQLVLEFFKAQFLVLHFSYCTFLMILSVILLSMRMVLLTALTVIRDLIRGSN